MHLLARTFSCNQLRHVKRPLDGALLLFEEAFLQTPRCRQLIHDWVQSIARPVTPAARHPALTSSWPPPRRAPPSVSSSAGSQQLPPRQLRRSAQEKCHPPTSSATSPRHCRRHWQAARSPMAHGAQHASVNLHGRSLRGRRWDESLRGQQHGAASCSEEEKAASTGHDSACRDTGADLKLRFGPELRHFWHGSTHKFHNFARTVSSATSPARPRPGPGLTAPRASEL